MTVTTSFCFILCILFTLEVGAQFYGGFFHPYAETYRRSPKPVVIQNERPYEVRYVVADDIFEEPTTLVHTLRRQEPSTDNYRDTNKKYLQSTIKRDTASTLEPIRKSTLDFSSFIDVPEREDGTRQYFKQSQAGNKRKSFNDLMIKPNNNDRQDTHQAQINLAIQANDNDFWNPTSKPKYDNNDRIKNTRRPAHEIHDNQAEFTENNSSRRKPNNNISLNTQSPNQHKHNRNNKHQTGEDFNSEHKRTIAYDNDNIEYNNKIRNLNKNKYSDAYTQTPQEPSFIPNHNDRHPIEDNYNHNDNGRESNNDRVPNQYTERPNDFPFRPNNNNRYPTNPIYNNDFNRHPNRRGNINNNNRHSTNPIYNNDHNRPINNDFNRHPNRRGNNNNNPTNQQDNNGRNFNRGNNIWTTHNPFDRPDETPITNKPPRRTTQRPNNNNNNKSPNEDAIVFPENGPQLLIGPDEEVMSQVEKRRYIELGEQMCDKYKSIGVKQLSAIPLLPSPDPVSVNVSRCVPINVPLVVGGKITSIQEFPHMTLLGWTKLEGGGYSWKCGGSLISDQHVLTAAHCAYQERDNSVVPGPPKVAQLGSSFLDDPGAIVIKVASTIRHPKYKLPKSYYDLAVVKLSNKVTFSERIKPACLGVPPSPGNPIIATGWGRTGFGRQQSKELRSVSIPVWEMADCYRILGTSRKLPTGPTSESQLCAGEEEGGKDTCQGDSGGPVQIQDGCAWRVVGVTSLGRSCGAAQTPGLYAIAQRVFIAAVVHGKY